MRIDRPREGDRPPANQWASEHIAREEAIDAQRRKYAPGGDPERWRTRTYRQHGLPRGERAPSFSADQARAVPDFQGGLTRGRLDVRGGPELDLASGNRDGEIMRRFKDRNGGRLPREHGFAPFNADHVEAQAAAYLRMSGGREASLYVNREPCRTSPHGCDGELKHMLPPGARMTVYGPDGFMKIYRGKPDENRTR